jgi:hypothetical protein
MNKIFTAQEFLISQGDKDFRLSMSGLNVSDMMIEFAKLHVTQALKEALESIPSLGSSTDIATYEEVEKAVLSSYPLGNIK